MFYAIRKHDDPAVQSEVQNIYRILTLLAGASKRKILTGSSSFNGLIGREIEIPVQNNTNYFVSVTPIDSAVNDWTLTLQTDKFIVKSADIGSSFTWAVIT